LITTINKQRSKHMKTKIHYLLLATVILLGSGCSSLKRGSSSFSDKPASSSKSSVTVKETPKTTTKPQTKEVVVKEEKIKVIESQQGESAGTYYVIIGSFKVLDNARNFRQQLITENFKPSILENENGLYRVSVASYDDEGMARTRIAVIRDQYEKYSDVWLLIRK